MGYELGTSCDKIKVDMHRKSRLKGWGAVGYSKASRAPGYFSCPLPTRSRLRIGDPTCRSPPPPVDRCLKAPLPIPHGRGPHPHTPIDRPSRILTHVPTRQEGPFLGEVVAKAAAITLAREALTYGAGGLDISEPRRRPAKRRY